MGSTQSKLFLWVVLIIAGSVSIFACNGSRPDDLSEIKIKLIMEEVYDISEPISAKIEIKGVPKGRTFISKGFNDLFNEESNDKTKSRYLFQEIRITDEKKRLLVARQHKMHYEFPDAPPVSLRLVDKEIIHALECEEIDIKSGQKIQEEDLREYYDFSISGNYTAQVQLSVMTFDDQPCSLKNGKLKLLKSDPPVKFAIKYPKSEKSLFKPKKVTRATPKDNHAKPRVLLAESINDYSSDQITPSGWTGSLETSNLIAQVSSVTPVRSSGGNPAARPKAVLRIPAQTTNVDINTLVKVEMQSMTSDIAVVMKVLGLEVYNSEYPGICQDRTTDTPVDCTQRTPSNLGAASYTLTYDHTIDPRIDFMPSQKIDISVTNTNKKKPNSGSYTDSFSFENAAASNELDFDEDGIPDSMEEKLGTNKSKKTLFVRPKKIDGAQFSYWDGFVALFPGPHPGFADIPELFKAGIEISVIGDPNHPYAPMRAFNYDPALDTDHPPCDIVEIVHMPATAYCVYGHYNFGHTYFFTSSAAWYWDTKGYVPNDQASAHYQKYGYFTPLIYPFAVENYFTEGAYPSIAENAMAVTTTNCGLNQCYETTHCSSLNVNGTNPATGRPDHNVELNNIIVFDSNKKISYVGAIPGTGYERKMVYRRTIAHELGHALLAASENDHCSNPACIMYGNVIDWEPSSFGETGICTHSPGGSRDIRATGVVHNRVH